jgi:hypothetical protein
MRRSRLLPSVFTTKRFIHGFEGDALYAAERDGKHYLIVNEAALTDMLAAGSR